MGSIVMSDRNEAGNEFPVLAPESIVTAIWGKRKNPQLSAIDIFLRSDQVILLKKKFGGRTPEERDKWFNRWLNSPNMILVPSPKELLDDDKYEEVITFVNSIIS